MPREIDASSKRAAIFANLTEEDKALLWSNVDVRSEDECWPWIGSRMVKDGRGKIKFYKMLFVAPRLILALKTGDYPSDDMFACHTCDNPPCCNPSHLWWGSHLANIADATKKGRMYKWNGERAGDLNPRAKLNAADIPKIRADQRMIKVIASEYGVGATAISNIKHGKTWSNV